MRKTVGFKFVQGRDIKTIATLVRGDIKAAIKAKKLPAGLEVSVKIRRYAGGCSLDVVVTNGAEGCFNPVFWAYLEDPRATGDRPARYTLAGCLLLENLKEICQAYHREESDSHTDYCNTNFFLFVKFDSTYEEACGKVAA